MYWMAWRIHQRVLRGEIDNRERGRVRGSIWLHGRNEPITLDLSGNCSPDLAGCLVNFENPEPESAAKTDADLATIQTGVAGEITASRKVHALAVPLDEALRLTKAGETPPILLENGFYLEWFSEANGRVVIESTAYQVDVSAPAWTPLPEDEEVQIAASRQAIREWLERADAALHQQPSAAFDPDEEKPLDEFGYEKFMRESDARTDRYLELREKYEGHPDQEKIVAREMGWTWLEEALEADERGALPPREKIELPPLEPNPMTEGIDWVRNEKGDIHHPMTKRASESGTAMWHYCNERGLLGENGDPDLHEMIFQFQIAGAKIAGALDGLAYSEDDAREAGLIVAALKRALNYLHTSLSAVDKAAQKQLLAADRLASFRAELFGVREAILALMQRYREKQF